MLGSFEVISTSARHIYHSAISVSPQTSIIRKLYKQYIHPLARVVRGLPISWGPNFATVMDHLVVTAVWSSCSRFIAVETPDNTEVLDGATLERLHTFEHPWSKDGWSSLSPDGRSLTWSDGDDGTTTWNLQTGGQISAIPLALDLPPLSYFSSAHSTDGKMVAFAHRDSENGAVTGISNAEETLTGFDKIVPVLPESRLRELGARYSCAAPFECHVVTHENLLTGQNPASAGPLARAVLVQLSD